ncbi:WD40-repeat-containing domain protein [Cercophora newfieldiana]|uniref:WD40-repeat-containing domain protein n=1 Tax=Cercophora newfieldiana TaxID=92897 RepID=A0AA39XS41_9PEZI|nr:WD40-repeat-containing domain protein [Cercophora newfieldiana]
MTFTPTTPPKLKVRRRSKIKSSPSSPLNSSPPCLCHSPSDSGYSSGPATPPSPEAEPRGLWMLGDGNQSEFDDPPLEDPFEDSFLGKEKNSSEHEVANLFWDVPKIPTQQKKPFTIPMRQVRPRPEIPASFRSDTDLRLLRRGPNIGLARHTARSQKHLDRFIPARSGQLNAAEKYRTAKEAHELSPSEKLLRHNGASEDAFCYRRRNITPLAADFRSQTLSESVPSINRVGRVLGPLDQNSVSESSPRQVSNGNVWAVGGIVSSGTAVDNGRGEFVRSGTNARLFRSSFPTAKPKAEEELEKLEARLAEALGLDRTQRILETNVSRYHGENSQAKFQSRITRTKWNGTAWANEGSIRKRRKTRETRILPATPFKVLDAPNLRDDFYCSILAYSATCHILAVGLSDLLYGWSETSGVKLLNLGTEHMLPGPDGECHLTSVAFSSTEGGKAILAYGRSNGTLGLMSLFDDPEEGSSSRSPLARFEVLQPAPVTCLSWKPTCTLRKSRSPINPGAIVKTDDLLVGDEAGRIYYYSVEWPDRWEVERYNWAGQMTLLTRVDIHVQQICGLAWSRDGELFATGGNDNLCCLFETGKILNRDPSVVSAARETDRENQEVRENVEELAPDIPVAAPSGENSEASSAAETEIQTPQDTSHSMSRLVPGSEKHRWMHGAAVKAIAFCPWQDGLVATGGGSNDKCIHFFHTTSGAPLATISVSAQVTSLIWSTTRHEIAATFGFAQPDHPVRIAIFSYPECRQVAAIPWTGEHRALYAIPFPSGFEESGSTRGRPGARGRSRTAMEGCIMVASSDKSVKFHEVWESDKKVTAGGVGMLGGSDILESLEGIDRDSDVIR